MTVEVGQLWIDPHRADDSRRLLFLVTHVDHASGLCRLMLHCDEGWVPIGEHYVSWMDKKLRLVSDVPT